MMNGGRHRNSKFTIRNSTFARCARALGIALFLLHPPAVARAATIRRIFEPTDLEFERPGTTELDMEFGLVRGQDAYRVSMPDFELDLGLAQNVELDLDGEFALGGPDDGEFRIDQLAQDNLWSALKLGLATWETKEADWRWALGAQIGPVWPLAPGAQGVGVEGIGLFGLQMGQSYFVLNTGALLQPSDQPGQPRAEGFVGGLDMEIALDRDGVWALTGELAGAAYWSPDEPQITTTLGIQWSPLGNLELSVTGLRGWLAGGDQWGILLGVAPKFRLW